MANRHGDVAWLGEGPQTQTQPTKFWKHVSSLTKHTSYTIHLYVHGTDVVKPVQAAEDPAKRLQSVRHTPVRCQSGQFSTYYLAVAFNFQIRHFEKP